MRWIARTLSLAATLAVALGALTASAQTGSSGDSRVPLPTIESARAGTTCIADPATMRRDHPGMLKHQRDETVHGGIRGATASLKGCIDCHASTKTGSVAAAPGDFCQSCHSYAAVKIDCFECHSAKPATSVARKK
ncbi:MAG: hypothetical protein KDG44_08740 [Burkholderiaceae bacterium]|nr:hypothetical protein [Burkholderiaceae bacterium]